MRNSKDTVLQEYKIKGKDTLLEFLMKMQVRKSRNAIKSLLVHKQIMVNGKLVTQFDQPLLSGDVVSVMKFNQARRSHKLQGVTIVYEDDYIIVVEKDAGVLSVGTDKIKTRTAFHVLNEYVKRKKGKDNRIFVLHRLDREMSGLMIFSKEADIQDLYQRNWDRLVLEYVYTGVIEGFLEPKNGTMESWLTENKNFLVFSSPNDNGGLHSVTHYKTVQSGKYYSLLDLRLETRRKNQVRAQLSQLKHPIVGDRKYGASGNPIKRIALHAGYMQLIHPVTGQRMEFISNLPKGMKELMDY